MLVFMHFSRCSLDKRLLLTNMLGSCAWVINAIGLYNVMFCGLHTANVNYLKQPCVTRLNMIIGPNVKHDHIALTQTSMSYRLSIFQHNSKDLDAFCAEIKIFHGHLVCICLNCLNLVS